MLAAADPLAHVTTAACASITRAPDNGAGGGAAAHAHGPASTSAADSQVPAVREAGDEDRQVNHSCVCGGVQPVDAVQITSMHTPQLQLHQSIQHWACKPCRKVLTTVPPNCS